MLQIEEGLDPDAQSLADVRPCQLLWGELWHLHIVVELLETVLRNLALPLFSQLLALIKEPGALGAAKCLHDVGPVCALTKEYHGRFQAYLDLLRGSTFCTKPIHKAVQAGLGQLQIGVIKVFFFRSNDHL